MTNPKHSPTPWHLLNGRDRYDRISILTSLKDDAQVVCRIANEVRQTPLTDEDEANAILIVEAVNAYEDNQQKIKQLREALLSGLKALTLNGIQPWNVIEVEQIMSALNATE